jgi:GDSL-like Lipase/Acylhydrolase family
MGSTRPANGRQHAIKPWPTFNSVAACLIAMTGSLALLVAAPQTVSAATAALNIVAVGDSYTAGNGAGAGTYFGPSGCYRSHNNYAERFFMASGSIGSYQNVACSGNVIDDLPTQVAQLTDQQRSAANLVFVSVGGNDAKFSEVVQNCFFGPPAPRMVTPCVNSIESAWGSLDSIVTRTSSALSALGNQFPNARIVFVGYPLLAGCDWTISGTNDLGIQTSYQPGKEVRLLGGFAEAKQKAAVAQLNAIPWKIPNRYAFFSRADLFAGHEVCGPLEPWVNSAPNLSLIDTWFHPNETGWTKTAEGLLAANVSSGLGVGPGVGEGASNPTVWQTAWSPSLGSPVNTVHASGQGCIQDFRGGALGDAALMQRNCTGAAYPVTGAHLSRVASIGVGTVGYPTNTSHRWGATWTQDFDAGSWGWNAVIVPDVSNTHAYVVRNGFWERYRAAGGAPGSWGVPLSDEYPSLAGAHQNFSAGVQIWRTYGDRVTAGQTLTTNDKRVSADERYQVVNQGDGNIVVYGPNGAMWSTGTAGRGQLRFVMQGDGNLVAYDGANRPLWSSGTDGYPGAYATMQSDGNFVVYDPTNYPLWSIYTGRITRPDPSITGIRSLANNLFVSAELGYAGGAYGMLRARAGGIGGWEQFRLVGDCRSTGGCAIQSAATGLYVSSELGYSGAWYGVLRARAGGIGGWERFRLVGDCWSTSGCAIVSVATGLFVSSELNYTGEEVGMLRASRGTALGWEKFSFR